MFAGSVTEHLWSFLGDGVGAALSRGPDAEQGYRKRLGENNGICHMDVECVYGLGLFVVCVLFVHLWSWWVCADKVRSVLAAVGREGRGF